MTNSSENTKVREEGTVGGGPCTGAEIWRPWFIRWLFPEGSAAHAGAGLS